MSIIRRASLGFGTYRITTGHHRTALRHALRSGIFRLIDTSPNYGNGASECYVGDAVRDWLNEGGVRSDLTIVTKVGVLQGADLADAKDREERGQPWPGVIKISPSAWHCISPEYIAHSVRRSEARLGLAPDVVLLHNPEFILANQLADQGCVNADFFYDRLGGAFSALSECHHGSFGVSSNIVGLQYSVSGRPNDHEAVDLRRVREAAGRHAARCNVVQLPLNLLEPAACMPLLVAQQQQQQQQPHGAKAEAPAANARAHGFTVLSHRPLHAIPPSDGLAGGFGVQRARHLTLRDERPMPPSVALIRNVAREALAPFVPDAHRLALEDIALLFALDAPSVDTVLSGMRTPAYIQRTAALLAERAPLSREAHEALATAMRNLIEELTSAGEKQSAQRPPARSPSGRGKLAMQPVPRHTPAPAHVAATARSFSSISGSGGSGSSGGTTRPAPPRHVDLPAASSAALQPSADGGPLAAVGMSDRGMGLVYRAGRFALDAAAATERTARRKRREGRWLLKVQPPLDNSSDARGGIGRMTPTTLLLHDAAAEYCAFVREEEAGHSALLRCALRRKEQVAYLWAEDVTDPASGARVVRVFTEAVDVEPGEAW